MSEKKVGPWRVRSVDVAFENPWLELRNHDVVQPNGEDGAYGVVHFKNLAIGVLPIDAAGQVWLVGQHRFALDQYSWELPEGGGPLDVDPLTSAKRELAEETGLTAASWAPLLELETSNSVTDERAVCYFAWDLSEGASAPDPTEILSVKTVPFRDLRGMVLDGEIRDGLTIAMVLAAHARALRGDAPAPISDHILA